MTDHVGELAEELSDPYGCPSVVVSPERLRAALAAAGLEVVDGWQPIETAPETGKVIVFGGRFTVPEERHADGGWWRYNRDNGSRSGPTFWRHMPEPPAHALTEGEG